MIPRSVFTIAVLVFVVYVDAFPFMQKLLENPAVDECISSSGIAKEDLEKRPDSDMSTEKLCFMKCLAEKMGYLSEDGDVNLNPNATHNPSIFPMHFPEDQQKEFLECVSNVGKIKECDDMSKVLECMPKPPNH